MSFRSNRRQFLGSVAALGAATAVPPAALGRTASQCDFDVIVIGGGFAGAVASRDCQKYGLRTLLLEARSRLGGRTFDTEWNGHHVELGGTWVHWMQPGIWSEIHRYGLSVTETVGAVPDRLIARAENFSLDEEAGKVAEEIARGGDLYFENARMLWERPWDPTYARAIHAANDSVTMLDRLKQVKLTPLQHHVVECFMETVVHNALEQGSYLEVARVFALGGYQWSLFNDVLTRYQITEGTGELIRRIAADGRAEIKLSAPVSRIEQQPEFVRVHAGNVEHTARAVILAVPMNCLAGIDCVPALSAAKVAASRERHAGSGLKFFAELKGRLGKVALIGASSTGIGSAFTYQELPNSTLIVGFSRDTRTLDATSRSDMQRALRRFIPNAEVLNCTRYPWVTDPFSLGTWCTYRPGKVLQWQDALAAREGRIFMAGSDVSEGSRGFIDGAVLSGAHAAYQVATSLSEKS